MKSFYEVLVLVTITLFVFGGMLISFENVVAPERLNNDSGILFSTLTEEYSGVTYEKLNITQVELNIQNEDAFSAEFYSASTDSQKKQSTLDTANNVPNLLRFTIGQEESFGWAWGIVMGFIVAVTLLIGFVIIFKREVFR